MRGGEGAGKQRGLPHSLAACRSPANFIFSFTRSLVGY